MEKDTEEIRGLVVFMRSGVGTKSEGVYPYVYRGRNAPPVKLYVKGDNPFENNALTKYDGVRVIAYGSYRNGHTDFVAEEVLTA